MLPIDIHTHTVASGHGTTDTIADLAKSAYKKGMTLLGISDHGPATPGACRESYFRSLKSAPHSRAGISVLYGAEANIINENGALDLPDSLLESLDFCIASIHPQSFRSPVYHRCSFWDRKQVTEDLDAARFYNTQAYVHAMENPYVTFIGHPDDQHYPVDCRQLAEAAAKNHVILEINELSLSPDGYRGDTIDTMRTILKLCAAQDLPILLSSDSHGAAGVGEAPLAEALIAEIGYPRDLIVNYMTAEKVRNLLNRHTTSSRNASRTKVQ